MFKRGYQGLDCVADADLDLYAQYADEFNARILDNDSVKYARWTVYYGAAVIVVAAVKHWWFYFADRRYRPGKPSSLFGSLVSVLTAYTRQVANHRVPVFLCTWLSFPHSVGRLVFMAATSLFLLLCCFLPRFYYRPCFGFGDPPLAVRAGDMATALVPFIFVLLGKANFVSLATGMGHERLNVIHRFVAVACLFLSLVHVIPLIWQPLHDGGHSYLAANVDDDYIHGIPCLVLLVLLCTLFKKWIRDRAYEFFIHIHWMMGIAFLGLLIHHVKDMESMQNFLYPAAGLFFAQLVYRFVLKTSFGRQFVSTSPALLRKLTDNAFEVTVTNSKLSWSPGQHCFVRFTSVGFVAALSNHPFSIASVKSLDELKFVIVPKGGLTKKLHEQLTDYASKSTGVFIDGPYGGPSRDARAFDNVVLVATGSGVTATMPFVSLLAEHIGLCIKTGKAVITRKIQFIWVVRHSEDVEWAMPELRRCAALVPGLLDIQIFVTRANSEKAQLQEQDGSITISHVRPSVNLVMHALQSSLLRKNMVVSCGSESMRSEVCEAVSAFQSLIVNSDKHHHEVEEVYLYTETFGW